MVSSFSMKQAERSRAACKGVHAIQTGWKLQLALNAALPKYSDQRDCSINFHNIRLYIPHY